MKTAIKRVESIITDTVRADKETLLYMTHSIFPSAITNHISCSGIKV